MRSPRVWSKSKLPAEAEHFALSVEAWAAARDRARQVHPMYAVNSRHSLLELAARLHARGGKTWSDLTAADVQRFVTVTASGLPRTHHSRVSRCGWVREFLTYLMQQGHDVSTALAAVPRQRTRRASSVRRPPLSPLMAEVRRFLTQRLPATRPGADWAERTHHALWDLVEKLSARGHHRWDAAALAELERHRDQFSLRSQPERVRLLSALVAHLRDRSETLFE